MTPTPIEASFGRAADRYLQHARVQEDFAAWLAEWAGGRPPVRADQPPLRALELGAGPGVFTRLLQPWHGEYWATDLSPAMVAAGAARVPSVRWKRAAAEQPPPGPWERIFSSSLLQWLDDPVAALAACRRAAAPGGRLLAGVFVRPTLTEWETITGAIPLAWRDPAEWAGIAEAAGWRLLRTETVSRRYDFPSARALLRSVHATGAAPYRRLSAPAMRRALEAYERACPAPPGPMAGGVTSTWTYCRLEADV